MVITVISVSYVNNTVVRIIFLEVNHSLGLYFWETSGYKTTEEY